MILLFSCDKSYSGELTNYFTRTLECKMTAYEVGQSKD